MNTVEVDSIEVVLNHGSSNYSFDVDDMENPDQYTEEVPINDDQNELADGMFIYYFYFYVQHRRLEHFKTRIDIEWNWTLNICLSQIQLHFLVKIVFLIKNIIFMTSRQ